MLLTMFNQSLNVLIAFCVIVLVACATVEKQQRTIYSTEIQQSNTTDIQKPYPDSVIRVATLNMAHGRKDSINQLFVFENTFKKNLDDIAVILDQYKPHVVALQEADASSLWSGSFDHVAYLSSVAGYPWKTHVSNAEGWLYSYGTALLSQFPTVQTIKHTFEPSPPTLDKGFVLAQIDWPSGESGEVRKLDVISVHLDFSRQSVREKQIKEMQEILSARMNPTIIMGDFNSEWLAETSVIKEFSDKSRYTAHEPGNDGFDTYKGKRLDWILISKDMEFISYQVLLDTLSDHAMIIADIRFVDDSDQVHSQASIVR